MSDSENHHHGKNEIIIVKRHGGGDHDGAHGAPGRSPTPTS